MGKIKSNHNIQGTGLWLVTVCENKFYLVEELETKHIRNDYLLERTLTLLDLLCAAQIACAESVRDIFWVVAANIMNRAWIFYSPVGWMDSFHSAHFCF
jgi:hypothetical protein